MSENIQYFSKGIWVSATKFHSPDVETDLNRIECIYSSLKTGSAASAFITFLLSLSGIMFFNFALISMSFLWIIPLMVSFFWLRSTLYNYVELYVEIAGQKKKGHGMPNWTTADGL